MKELSSSEFRRTFHQLIEPVTVTVLGRPIGSYTPIMSSIDDRAVMVTVPDLGDVQMRPGGSFRPVPKPVGKKR